MKSIPFKSIVLSVLFSALAGAAFANSLKESSETKAYPNVTQQLTEAIGFPGFIRSNSEENIVKAMLQVDTSGKVSLLELNASNPELKRYVEEQINRIHLKTAEATVPFLLTLKFQL